MGSVCVWKSWNIEHQVHSHTSTHDVSNPSAPPAASDATAPPEDNDQARKTAEHGEQWDGGVDAVDPGDPARSGGAANRLNTRRNSQSKCGARRNAAAGQQPKQPRATAQSIGVARPGRAPDRSSAWRGRGTYRTTSPHRHRGCWPRGAAPTSPGTQRHRPQPAQGGTRPTAAACRWRSRRGRCRRA